MIISLSSVNKVELPIFISFEKKKIFKKKKNKREKVRQGCLSFSNKLKRSKYANCLEIYVGNYVNV